MTQPTKVMMAIANDTISRIPDIPIVKSAMIRQLRAIAYTEN